jgi:hypothetical protein
MKMKIITPEKIKISISFGRDQLLKINHLSPTQIVEKLSTILKGIINLKLTNKWRCFKISYETG